MVFRYFTSRYIFILIFLFLSGCFSDSSDGGKKSEPILDSVEKPEHVSDSVRNSEAITDSGNLILNQFYFGDILVSFSDGNFGKVSYQAEKEFPKLVFFLDEVDKRDKNLLVKISNPKSPQVALIVFPDILSNFSSVYFYGIRSDKTPIATQIELEKPEDIAYIADDNLTINIGKGVQEVGEKLGKDISLDSYLKPGSSFQIVIGWSNSSILEGVEVSDRILEGFRGDLRIGVEEKITKGTTFGFSGTIEVE